MPELIPLTNEENKEEEKREETTIKENETAQKQNKARPLLSLSTRTQKNTAKTTSKSKPVTRSTSKSPDLYEKMEELIGELRKVVKIQYALLSFLQREIYEVTEELDDPILSKLSPKAKKVFIYIMEMSRTKKTIPSLTIMARFNLTQEELFQIVNEINKVIQQYGFSIRFIELEAEEGEL